MTTTTLPVFSSPTLTVACTSDTHNETPVIPAADIFIHAGDITDRGTASEFEAAYNWLASLPHRLKVVIPGNNDRGLCPKHPKYSAESHNLFTSAEAWTRDRIIYLTHETRTVAWYRTRSGEMRPLNVYANPSNPDFLAGTGAAGLFGNPWGFAYLTRPDPGADANWRTAPERCVPEGDGDLDAAQIWVTHTPPLGRLDASPSDRNPQTGKEVPISGCEVLAEKIGVARPLLNVFGHLHGAAGIEKVHWKDDESGNKSIGKAEIVALQNDEVGSAKSVEEFDFTWGEVGSQSVFVNAAWMPLNRKVNHRRNSPWLIRISLEHE